MHFLSYYILYDNLLLLTQNIYHGYTSTWIILMLHKASTFHCKNYAATNILIYFTGCMIISRDLYHLKTYAQKIYIIVLSSPLLLSPTSLLPKSKSTLTQ